jgi:hypothetical protein
MYIEVASEIKKVKTTAARSQIGNIIHSRSSSVLDCGRYSRTSRKYVFKMEKSIEPGFKLEQGAPEVNRWDIR